MTAEAVIDLRTDGTMIVQSYSRTDDFLWIATGAPVRLPFAMPDAGLSVAVAAALSESLVGIPRPERLDGLMAPALKAAGVRSQRTYYEGTRSVVVQESDDGSIQVGPTWRRGREFLPLNGSEVFVASRRSESLGSAVRQALALSRG